MNYRHAFHAGNFADLVKHAVLLQLLARLTERAGGVQVIDTHAGAGGYDLQGEAARKSGEAQAGVARLMADGSAPQAFDRLKAAVRKLNGAGPVLLYPGSPLLVVGALRVQDRYLACELRSDDHAVLRETLADIGNAQTREADGYATAANALDGGLRNLVLIDPPFEAADDYMRIVGAASAVLAKRPKAVVAVWVPLKDLETFDSLLRRFENASIDNILVAETRLRPLRDPMKMNGCAMVLVNSPPGLEADLTSIVQWTAQSLGDAGGLGRVWRPAA
jgi:23S rRNA (adenine2030-N6)-methyltransferase